MRMRKPRRESKTSRIKIRSKRIKRLANTWFNRAYAERPRNLLEKDTRETRRILYDSRKTFKKNGLRTEGVDKALGMLSLSKDLSNKELTENLGAAWDLINKENLTLSHLEAQRSILNEIANDSSIVWGSVIQQNAEQEGTVSPRQMLSQLSYRDLQDLSDVLDQIRMGGGHGATGEGSGDEYDAAMQILYMRNHSTGGFVADQDKIASGDYRGLFVDLINHAKENVARKSFNGFVPEV